MRIEVLALAVASCAHVAADRAARPRVEPDGELTITVHATALADTAAVRLEYEIKNVGARPARILGALAGSYAARARRAFVTREGDGPIEVRLGTTEGCTRCVSDPRGVAGDRPPAGLAFETLDPGASLSGAVELPLPGEMELAREFGIALVVRLAAIDGGTIAGEKIVRSEPARPAP